MSKNYKYVIFSPYFGKLPINFDLWLSSCSYNKDFKFIVFTDDRTKYSMPKNVEIVSITFQKFVEQIQEKFDFKISLKYPYKLCDFKPVYGYVFLSYIEECDYWGYCDMDLIFGNLKKYLPKKIDLYDKISYMGHFCMYKNNKSNNEMFMYKINNTIDYTDILSNEQHFGFDEIGDYGINNIFKVNNLKIYDYQINVADVTCKKENFIVSKFQNDKFTWEKFNRVFVYDRGKILSYYLDNESLKIKEYAYLHFQKRKMKNDTTNNQKYIIKYNGFIDYFDINESNINSLIVPKYKPDLRWIKIKLNGIKRRLKKNLTIKKILKNKKVKL